MQVATSNSGRRGFGTFVANDFLNVTGGAIICLILML